MEDIDYYTFFAIGAVVIIQFILANISLVHLLKNKNPRIPAVLWHIIILVLFIVGPIAYNIVERRKNNDKKDKKTLTTRKIRNQRGS